MNKGPDYMKRFIVFILLSFPFFGFSAVNSDSLSHGVSTQLEKAEQAIWKILILEDNKEESLRFMVNGTGFFVGASHFITNFHVVSSMLSRPENDIVLSQGGNTTYVKRILAVSEMEESTANFLSLREDLPEPDENLFITAYPNRVFTRIEKTGDISYENGQYYTFSVNRSVLAGASGAPVLDEQGQVVGVAFAAVNNFLHVVKVNHLRELITGNIGTRCPDVDFNTFVRFAVSEACVRVEIENLKKLAEEGSVYAQFHLSRVFGSFSNLLDIDQAFQWTKISAEQNHAPSQYSLAVMYVKDEGVVRDLDQAFQWMRRSAERGYAPAQRKLAIMYSEGEGVVQDLDQAFQWMRRSAEKGYPSAQYNLAVMYFTAEGVAWDLDQASQWMRRSAEQGYAPAQYILNFAHPEVVSQFPFEERNSLIFPKNRKNDINKTIEKFHLKIQKMR